MPIQSASRGAGANWYGAQSNSVYVSVLKIPIVPANSVSKSIRQVFFCVSGSC